MRPKIIAVAGIASNVGKTTLVCELLRRLPGWEAIKITRGHLRSCGNGPECCVSDLLQAEPLIYSGRNEQTDCENKDTGRYWEAGASNVHWVIVNSSQVEAGIKQALTLVRAPGVIVEGTSFLKYVPADFAILVVNPQVEKIKPSARKILGQIHALYNSEVTASDNVLEFWLRSNRLVKNGLGGDELRKKWPVFGSESLNELARVLTRTGADLQLARG